MSVTTYQLSVLVRKQLSGGASQMSEGVPAEFRAGCHFTNKEIMNVSK